MPYLLKPKRYGMLRDINTGSLYKSKWRDEPYTIYRSQNEANIILDSELSIVKFLRSRIQEDIADAAQKKHVNLFHFIMNLDGKPIRELIKNNFHAFKRGSNRILEEADWAEKNGVDTISSSPWNYKIYKLETVVSNGVTLQRQIPMTWHQFFKQCKNIGIEDQCVYSELE